MQQLKAYAAEHPCLSKVMDKNKCFSDMTKRLRELDGLYSDAEFIEHNAWHDMYDPEGITPATIKRHLDHHTEMTAKVAAWSALERQITREYKSATKPVASEKNTKTPGYSKALNGNDLDDAKKKCTTAKYSLPDRICLRHALKMVDPKAAALRTRRR